MSRAVGGVRVRRFFRDWVSFDSERCSIHWPERARVVIAAEASKNSGACVLPLLISTKRL